VCKGDLSLMGNEFKVMEMNVLFEVQKALAGVILSHADKWKRRWHMVPSPRRVIRGECDVSGRSCAAVLAWWNSLWSIPSSFWGEAKLKLQFSG